MKLRTRTAMAAGIVALITACGAKTSNNRGSRADNSNYDAGTSDSWKKDFCEVDIQTIEDAGEIVEIDPSKVQAHDGDSGHYVILISQPQTSRPYRLSAADAAELGNNIWPDQYGTGDFLNINYGQLGKEFVVNAFRNAHRAWHVRGTRDPNAKPTDDGGRNLGHFVIDGQLLTCQLVAEGLAYETVSYYYRGRDPPQLAQIVLNAAKRVGEPHFMRPDLYKQQYRH